MEDGKKQSRKEFLRKVALGSAGLVVLGSLGSCEPPEPEMLLGKLADLDSKGSITGEFNGDLVMAMKDQRGEIVIFSLVCRHKRCTVEWKPEPKEFHCPCHEGKYNAKGMVIAGPPPGPLKRFKYKIEGEDLWVLNDYLEA